MSEAERARPAEPEPAHPAEPEPARPAEPAPERVLPTELDVPNGIEYFKICVPLHNAALEGNWEAAKKIIENDHSQSQTVLRNAIAKGGSTILHVAALARKRTFMEKLLNSVEQNYNDDLISILLLKGDMKGNNGFCIAAATGDVEIAKLMLKKKSGLQNICGPRNKTPLFLAVLFGQRDMANYLYRHTENSLIVNELKDLFIESIKTDLYGITLKLLNRWENPSAIWERQAEAQDINENVIGGTALLMLAHKPNLKTDDDALTLVKRLWESLINSRTSHEVRDLVCRMLFDAAKLGNFEFIEVAVHFYPDLIYEFDENRHSIFHLAVKHRHVRIFDLINTMGFHKDLLTTYEDHDGNNILHLAAKYPNPPPAKIVPGAALELQREILMFEEVERIFQPSYRDQKNKIRRHSVGQSSTATEDTEEGYTPKELFTRSHKELRERGEKWMKSTATSCMLVATLIATVVFAAAFTVPGGNDQVTGKPILLHKNFFKVFAVSDAIALFTSSISILMFLSILTSRYEERDFRMQLPLKLMVGLLTLFISVIAMTLAFSSAIFSFYSQRWNAITGPSFALVLVTASLYLVLHFSLLRDVIRSTFCFRHSSFCSKNQIKTKRLPV